ncbi:MAG TPA: DUF4845 domain-containing protein [Steroidobacteraceae bacterium]|nr:DUF4845 domain-containing protein [Steroidobacteraceae bacterium]
MRSRQRGITFIGWVVLLVPLAVVMLAVLKVLPLYMNQFKVAKAMEETAAANRGDSNPSPQVMHNELEKRFDIESIETPNPQDVEIAREGDVWVMTAQYDREATLFGNLSLLVHFSKRVVLQ